MFSKTFLSGLGLTGLGFFGKYYKPNQRSRTRNILSCASIGLGAGITLLSFVDFSTLDKNPEGYFLSFGMICLASGCLGIAIGGSDMLKTLTNFFCKEDIESLRIKVAGKKAEVENLKMRLATLEKTVNFGVSSVTIRRERFDDADLCVNEAEEEQKDALLAEEIYATRTYNVSDFKKTFLRFNANTLKEKYKNLECELCELNARWGELLDKTATINMAFDQLLYDQHKYSVELGRKNEQLQEQLHVDTSFRR